MIKIISTAKEYHTHTNNSNLPDDWYSADSILKYTLLLKRKELIQTYAKATGMSEIKVEHEWEQGIDNWIGFGSATCFELGCSTYVGFQGSDIVVIIE